MMRIALIGKAGSGKSTAAKYLTDRYGFVRWGFTDPLKEAARKVGWRGAKDEKGRRLLQEIGDAARRHNPSAFIEIIQRRLQADHAPKHIVVDDVRLAAEVDALREERFFIFRVTGRGYGLTGGTAEHVTEQITDIPVDDDLWNGDCLKTLEIGVDRLIGRYGRENTLRRMAKVA